MYLVSPEKDRLVVNLLYDANEQSGAVCMTSVARTRVSDPDRKCRPRQSMLQAGKGDRKRRLAYAY